MRYQFIRAHREQFHLTTLCHVLRVSPSGFYAWLQDPLGRRGREAERWARQIRELFLASRRTYGSRRIHRLLRQRWGAGISRRRVRRLMRQLGLYPQRRRRFRVTTDSHHGFAIHPNLLDRQFSVDAVNRVWVADLTYIWTDEGWLYLATLVDLFSRKVVGWSMSETLESTITQDALRMALADRHPAPGLIHHSDRGVQYACGAYQELLQQAGAQPSMSRKGNCWDNAVAESFFATLKKEWIYRKKFATRAEARREIFDYIEVFYNRQRLHTVLDYRSPVEFEAVMAAKAA